MTKLGPASKGFGVAANTGNDGNLCRDGTLTKAAGAKHAEVVPEVPVKQ